MQYSLIMYSRTSPCPFVSLARRVFEREGVPCHEIFIEQDPEAERRVVEWTGFLSVPTLVVALPGEVLPFAPPLPLLPGSSPRGIDRGAMLTEPGEEQLVGWLRQHGFIGAAS